MDNHFPLIRSQEAARTLSDELTSIKGRTILDEYNHTDNEIFTNAAVVS